MANINFTPAQRDAIGARGGSLLVSAAAGSGKTRVLVERAVGLITDPDHPADADSLLIMTFTNAAAAKLRADITERLEKEVRADPANTRLRRQQMRLQRASIGTVDAFCLHFVQQHFTALDIPPDFETADPSTLGRIEQECLAAVLEEAYADPDFRAFADLYDRGRTDNTAGQSVLELYAFTQTLPRPDAALDEFAAMWRSDAPPQDTAWGRALLRGAAGRCDGARKLAEAALAVAARDEEAARAYTDALADDRDQIALLQKRIEAGRWDAAVEILRAIAWRRPGRIRGGKAGNPTAQAAGDLRDRAKKQIEKLKSDFLLCTGAEFAADRAAAAAPVAALVRAVKRFRALCFAARVEEKSLDYTDYEHLTLELLQAPDGSRTPLCETVSRRYSAVMVDEYQDTNALQDAIYFSLAKPDASNLFFVGDIKQSIYRFRQADPSVFVAKQTGWPPYPAAGAKGATIALDANFRSAPAVIEGINYFFETFFTRDLGGIDYGPGQRLVVGKPDGSYPGLCELDVIEGADTAGDARAIAARIAGMCAEGFPVRGREGIRPCGYGDFCILLRSRGAFATYEAALNEREIPVYADVATDLLDAPHVRPFAALLKIIDNPAQDVELAAVLLSPLYPYTPDDLVGLRGKAPGGSLYAALLQDGSGRFAPFLDDLAAYRRLACTLPVGTLIEELFARTGYLAAVGAMPDGARCRDDLRGFAAWAAGAGTRGLSALVRAMAAAAASGGVPAAGGAGQSRPGCVSIMTVHRSKGLEFPVVFVADTTHGFNLRDLTRPVLDHRTLGVGLMLRAPGRAKRYKTLPYAAVQQTVRAETLSEEMRILYVALTRAQDALIITAPVASAAKALEQPALCAAAGASGMMQGFTNWAGWLLTAALRHPGGDALRALAPAYARTIPDAPGAPPLKIALLEAPEAADAPEPAPPAKPDPALYAALLERFGWRSPDAPLRDTPAKVSVTAVTHGSGAPSLQRPAFLQKSGMTGAERGTAIHAFMQSVPFDAPMDDLAAEVERQKALRLLDPALADQLDLAPVRRFFESAVWRRIRRAARVLREVPFITTLPAGEVLPDAGAADAPVLVQGIADVVLAFDDHAEILDYKTDRSTDAAYYIREYAAQLRLYRRAFALRLGMPVTKLTIYSFTMGREIDVPLER